MPSASKQILSGSTNGRGIKVTTAAPVDGSDTTIHTAVAGTTATDYVTLYAYNDDTLVRYIELGWGGTTDIDDTIRVDVPPISGLTLVTYKLPLRNGLVIVASAETANKIVIFGTVTRVVD